MMKQNLTKKISLEISDFQISTSFNINSQNIQSISDLKHAISDFFQISQNEFQIENPPSQKQINQPYGFPTIRIKIFKPSTKADFYLPNNKKISISNYHKMKFRELIEFFKDECYFFSYSLLQSNGLQFFNSKEEEIQFPFIPVYHSIFVKLNEKTVKIDGGPYQFYLCENESAIEAYALIQKVFRFSEVLLILNQHNKKLSKNEKLDSLNQYKVQAIYQFHFKCDKFGSTTQCLNYFASVVDAQKQLAFVYNKDNSEEELKQENIKIWIKKDFGIKDISGSDERLTNFQDPIYDFHFNIILNDDNLKRIQKVRKNDLNEAQPINYRNNRFVENDEDYSPKKKLPNKLPKRSPSVNMEKISELHSPKQKQIQSHENYIYRSPKEKFYQSKQQDENYMYRSPKEKLNLNQQQDENYIYRSPKEKFYQSKQQDENCMYRSPKEKLNLNQQQDENYMYRSPKEKTTHNYFQKGKSTTYKKYLQEENYSIEEPQNKIISKKRLPSVQLPKKRDYDINNDENYENEEHKETEKSHKWRAKQKRGIIRSLKKVTVKLDSDDDDDNSLKIAKEKDKNDEQQPIKNMKKKPISSYKPKTNETNQKEKPKKAESKTTNKIKYFYQTNLDKEVCEIELNSDATVEAMKQEIAKINDVQNLANIKVIFAGKDLLNDICLESLNIGDVILFIYIRSEQDILLMTAKALRI